MELRDLANLKQYAKERIYQEYLQKLEEEERFYYSDYKLTGLEEYIKNYKLVPEHHDAVRDDETICNNCLEIVNNDDMGESELATTDNICKRCMGDGYGK